MKAKRHSLPADRRWALSPSQVFDALDQGGVPHPSWIRRSRPYRPQRLSVRQSAGSGEAELIVAPSLVLTASWNPSAGWGAPWEGGPEVVTVAIADVAAANRSLIVEALLTTAVPELVQWLRWAAGAPEGWRILRHCRAWYWTQGRIISRELGR
jgi:hypothetical protein